MKRVLSLFLSVLMLTSVVAAVDLSAYASEWDGSQYDGFWSYIVSNKKAYITDYEGTNVETSITIPAKLGGYPVVGIKDGYYPFSKPDYDSDQLKQIKVSKNNSYFTSVDGVLFNKDKTELYCYPNAKSGSSYTIPSTVYKIHCGAFENCKKLKTLIIPDNVTTLWEGICCSKNGNSIETVEIGNGVTKISDYEFYQWNNLSNVTLPFKLKQIGSEAFNYTNITEITVPQHCSKISYDAFNNGSKVTIYNKSAEIYNSERTYLFSNVGGYTTFYSYSGSTIEEFVNNHSNGYYRFVTLDAHSSHSYETTTVKATTHLSGGDYKVCSVCSSYKTVTSYPKISTMSLSTSSYTYNASSKKPTVTVKDSKGNKINSKYYTVSYTSCASGNTTSSMKSVGKYYVKVKFKSKYSGSLKKTVTIKPKKTSIKSVQASSKGFAVKWNKQATQTTGYQVQYSTSKSFKSAKTKTISKTGTTSKKVTGLKAKKKYYVRVRTYKTVKVNGKNTKIYSAWSSAKGVTTKK